MIRLIKKHCLGVFVTACIMLAITIDVQAQTLNTVWERTSRTGSAEALPSWFTVGSVRGMAYGTVDGNARVYAADRANSTIQVMDAATGADVTLTTAFDLSGVTGGTLPMNDIEVSDDGVIFLGNLASATSPFRLYWWTQEGGAYADSTTIPVAGRVGDKFTVVGSLADNTIEVWMATATSDPGIVYVATTADQGATWSVEEITLSGTLDLIGSSADAAPLELGRTSDFYVGGNSSAPARYSSAGAYVANSALASASRNGMEIFEYEGKDHLAVYTYRPDGASGGNKTGQVYIYDISDGSSPTIVNQSPLMGDDADSFSSIHGEAEVSLNEDGTYNVYALEGVNGLVTFTNAEPPLLDDPSNLIFSEYIEGSGNNKALEITNLSDSTISLENYRIAQSANGNGWAFFHTFAADAMIAPGEQYVLITNQVDAELFAAENANEVLSFPSPIHHNGNDARGIIHIDAATNDTTYLDVIGDPNSDSNWDVAGVTGATANHTLWRKSSVMIGNNVFLGSFGTDEASSEWIVKDQNDFSNLGMPTPAAGPDTVDVTFTVNMATVNDTISSNYEVSINGYFKSNGNQTFASGETTTWDANATAQLTNIGGDYWQGTFKMVAGDTLHYKYRYNLENVAGRDEAGLLPASVDNPDGNDLRFVIADADKSLDVEYFNTTGSATVEDTKPFVSDPDSITVYFRVNMGGKVQNESFDPATDIVGIRGGSLLFGADWSSGTTLTKETEDRLDGNVLFYNTAVKIAKTSADTVDNIEYKFVEGATDDTSVGWEDNIGGNRSINIPSADTTVQWVYFDNVKPTDAKIVTTALNFDVNVGILEGLGLFNTSIDTMIVTGGFDNFGRTKQMDFSSLTGTYSTSFPFTGAVGSTNAYKYFVKWDSRRDSSNSEFFLGGITADGSGWEEPGITGGGNRTFELQDAETQPTLSSFYNDISPEARLTANNVDGGAISVTFSVDMTPAMSHTTPFVPASDSLFLFVDTPFFALTNNITVPGDAGQNFAGTSAAEKERLMFTDDDSDMIYTLTLDLNLPTLNNIGFRFAYGEPTSPDGSMVINGEGFDAGRRHYQYIQPQVDSELNITWPSTFNFPQLTWKATDLPFEQPPSYTTVGLEDELANVESFKLNQNYPNPFNPSTTISFNLPNAADVRLTVYNVLGQRVATLLNNVKYTSGSHTLSFDASNLASGIYIYRLEAGTFTSQKRMTLIK